MKQILAIFAALAFVTADVTATEPKWPDRAVRAIVPFPAGSSADTASRIVMVYVSRRIGQQIVIDNRSGAGGTSGSSLVAHAKPDGYTLLIPSSSHTISPAVYSNLNYDPATDLVGVAPLTTNYSIFVSSAAKPYHTLKDLVDYAKTRPGAVDFASAGNGTITQIGPMTLALAAGFKATHIPYKGTAVAVTDLMAGRIDFFMGPLPIVGPYIKTGQLVPLAVAGTSRMKALPDVPTTGEAGYPGVVFRNWIAVLAPSGTPRSIVERINAEINAALRDPEVLRRIEAIGSSAFSMSVAQFDEFLKAEFARNAKVVEAIGLKPH